MDPFLETDQWLVLVVYLTLMPETMVLLVEIALAPDALKFNLTECVKLFWNYLRSSQRTAENNWLQQIKTMLMPHEKRVGSMIAVPSVSDISLCAVVDAFASIVHATKGVVLFGSAVDSCCAAINGGRCW